MAWTSLPRNLVIFWTTVVFSWALSFSFEKDGGRVIPASSRNVGDQSITVLKERLKEPGVYGRKVSFGGFTTQGTRIPPWEGNPLKRRDGAVEA